MYDANKRRERYLKNADKERELARERYHTDSENINLKRREEYNKNIEKNREKLRIRQAKRRARLKSYDTCQNDTADQKTGEKQCQYDTK